ncbi:hypothetical protein KR059_001006 [Drosophila kikkawai]|nr:hypothetical protein KR059_001006 [Drosophila kikkawai]
MPALPNEIDCQGSAADINDNFGMDSHIYENLPGGTSPKSSSPKSPKNHPVPILRKYFRREAIYENLCAGCGYGVFGAPGRYCHFCQCIVSGGVVVPAAPLAENSSENPQDSNIYENICELCRGIYSDNEKCQCQKENEKENTKDNYSTPRNTTLTPTPTPTPLPMPTSTSLPAAKTNSRSRTLLNYSKSSAATLTRLFGSLKQLNRSASLQRKLFQREVKVGGGGGSLEIIHNVDEVFRTQETFDMQRICQLKSELQLKTSQSDQHIYGRVREPPEPDKAERKRPRLSRMRLLQQSERDSGSDSNEGSAGDGAPASLYLNESICHWMTSLRQQVHHYDEGAGAWQQLPKSVPAAYEREPTAEEPVTLRKEDKLSLISDFKRKLQLKREPPQDRRCGITAEFVNEFLSQKSHPQSPPEESQPPMTVSRAEEMTALPKIPLLPLMQSLALSISLHVCVRGPLSAYDKSLSQWLWEQQQRLLINGYRGRARDPRHEGRGRRLFARALAPRAPSSVSGRASLFLTGMSVSRNCISPHFGRGGASQNVRDDVYAAARASGRAREGASVSASDSAINNSNSSSNNNNSGHCAGGRALMAAPKTTGEAERPNNNNNNNSNSSSNNNDDNDSSTNNNNNNNANMSNCNVSDQQQQQQQKPQEQQQQITQNCVIKVRRPAPKVPVRSPQTALSNPRQADSEPDKEKHSPTMDMEVEEEDEEEESIYQPIWQFKTLEHPEIVEAQATNAEDDDDEDDEEQDDDDDDDEDEDEEEVLEDYDESLPSDADADVMALQAAAVFAAGVRHKLSTSTLTKRSKLMLPTPLPSPTASMDQGAWETDMEFMFHRESKNAEEAEAAAEAADSLSLGSTITNSTATMGSISSTGSSARHPVAPRDQVPVEQAPLIHPILRNICIFYSPKEPKKYSAIFYEYQRSQIHLRFMTRIRRPAPPPPVPSSTQHPQQKPPPAATVVQQQQQNDDSGCSCEAEDQVEAAIPKPLKEEWARAVLAAGVVHGKRGVASRAGRKLRVRSNARLLLTDSVLAWREQLQDVHCCEDEEDMIVPVTDILQAQQIQEDNELQQTQQSTILQRFKSVSIGNLLDLPGEEDKKSIKNRMRMKFAVNSNVFRINRSPKSEKKSRGRRGQVNSLYLDEQQKYPLFAAPLNALELNMTDHPNVPRFVVDVCAYIEKPECIEQDGIYRASGNKVLVDELRRKLTHLYDPQWLQTDDIHTLTSLHKQFFRELTSPLITQEAYERLGKSLADDAAIERMSLAFDDMPEPNRSTLRFLIKHLTRVAAASASNRMPSTNLAIVWGPCLLSANQIHLDIGRMNMLAKVLIENYDRIFHADNERLVC